jgi:hypothetical protein
MQQKIRLFVPLGIVFNLLVHWQVTQKLYLWVSILSLLPGILMSIRR